MYELWATIKNYAGNILLGLCAFLLLAALGLMFWQLTRMITGLEGVGPLPLPLLAIGGVVVLILMLTAVAMIFSILGLTNKEQAMGLPEGSIRAVISLSLIVLFAILSVFLYQGVSTNGPLNTIENLSDAERTQFIRDHATARDIQSAVVKDKAGEPLLVKDKDGQPVKNPDGTPKYLYNVSYRSANAAGDDFAKQLLVLLGTLMTAITSFYLGAKTATSAATASQTAGSASPQPTVSGIKPTSHSVANDGAVIHLEVMGANLNIITHVKIVRTGAQPVIGEKVGSSPTSVTCEIRVSATTTPPGAPWDVVVDDGAAKSATLPGALTIDA